MIIQLFLKTNFQMTSFFLNLKCEALSSEKEICKSSVFLPPETFKKFLAVNQDKTPIYIELSNFIFTLELSENASKDFFQIGRLQRDFLGISVNSLYKLSIFSANSKPVVLTQITLKISKVNEDFERTCFEEFQLSSFLKKEYSSVYFKPSQCVNIKLSDCLLKIEVLNTESLDLGFENERFLNDVCGIIDSETDIEIMSDDPANLVIKTANGNYDIFKKKFSLSHMNVGGLNKELHEIFRRIFASRRFPSKYLLQFGITHVRGILLFGPPGTGKTLIAREIAKGLRSKNIRIVNGPEILNRYVGESEKLIRELFEEARNDQSKYGEESPLHVIIFDEIDAICKKRGVISSDSGVNDSVVNQLLSMIDGVDSLNNVIIIGMTNRKDLLDDAILRPGRLEIHVEIGLPDEHGRKEIFEIHTKQLREHKRLAKDVDFEKLVKLTENFTGAEISGAIRNACSYTFQNTHKITDFSVLPDLNVKCEVSMNEFEKAIRETVPYFGKEKSQGDKIKVENMQFSGSFEKLKTEVQSLMLHYKTLMLTHNLMSILFEGESGCGKTSWAFWTSTLIEFSFLKIVNEEAFLGYDEPHKIQALVNIFEDSYNSKNSCIILDNVEQLIGFISLENRYCQNMVRTIASLISKGPKKMSHKQLVIMTTNNAKLLAKLELASRTNVAFSIPSLESQEQIVQILTRRGIPEHEVVKISKSLKKNVKKISLKRLIFAIDLYRSNNVGETFDKMILNEKKQKTKKINI